MNCTKFFELAKSKGITSCQIMIGKGKATSLSLYHHEIDNFNLAEDVSIAACGIYEGKFGSCVTERTGVSSFKYLVDGIIKAAKTSEKDDDIDIFPGSPKYRKKSFYNKGLSIIPIQEKIDLIKEIEAKLESSSDKVHEVDSVAYQEEESETEFQNSFGLKLHRKMNFFAVFASVNGKDGENTRSAYNLDFGNDLGKFDLEGFVKETKERLVSQFGAGPCESGHYPTVLKQTIFGSLVDYFLATLSAEEIQKHSSKMEGQLGKRVASKKLNMKEDPYGKNIFYRYFDSEGVATQTKKIIDHGVLKTYFYNRRTAKKDGVETTGNASWGGGKIGIGYSGVVVSGTKKSFEEMIAPIEKGVYITSIQGLGTGMNIKSGDFSCQAQGFMIESGKLGAPLTLITLSGNLYKMLQDIVDLDNDVRLLSSSTSVPQVYIKSMSIGGR